MKYKAIVASLLVAVTLGGCATNQDTGTLIGAATGGLIGNQFGRGGGRVAATAAGVIVGGLIGNRIGKDLDEEDRRRAREAELYALENGRDGEPRRWQNPNNKRYGVITPRRVYTYERQTCREYEHTIYIDGRPETVTGRACRQPDGTWRQV